MIVRLIIFILFFTCYLFAQSKSGALIGGLYSDYRGSVGVFVGDKTIARLEVTFTALNEFSEEINFSQSQTFFGPFVALGSYKGETTPNLLGRYRSGRITGIQIMYKDRTTETLDRQAVMKMAGEYFARVGRGY